jgi:hypothetical protein
MQDTNAKPSATTAPRRLKQTSDTGNLQERLAAAGLDDGEGPENMDEFRRELTRRIYMFLNQWHGCPERICQRNRGCMAPETVCSNVEQLPPDQADAAWRAVQHEVYTALKKCAAEAGLEDE